MVHTSFLWEHEFTWITPHRVMHTTDLVDNVRDTGTEKGRQGGLLEAKEQLSQRDTEYASAPASTPRTPLFRAVTS
jgi:hypothetical protein